MKPGLLRLALVLFAAIKSGHIHADAFCFTLAENYYEQVYCELQAAGQGNQLPAWRDFRNNDATTQALLLKRPAARAGIEIRLPKPQPARDPASQAAPPPTVAPVTGGGGSSALSACQLQPLRIQCGDRHYRFVSNRRNSELSAGALSADNRMNLPAFHGDAHNPAGRDYLGRAFAIYLRKMIDIGLGENTLNFARFQFIFQDLRDKGLDFSQRFETMYHYLKKDKASIGVRVATAAPDSLGIDDCQPVGDELISCSQGRAHYLFMR